MGEKRTTRSHYKVINGQLVTKKCYETEKDALTVARFLNTRPNIINKMVAYKCFKCDKWHIGSTGKPLTDKDRERARYQLVMLKNKVL